MLQEILLKQDAGLSEISARLQNLENQVRRIDKKLQFQPGLPGFEFVIESEGNEIWSGTDLQTGYLQILQKYPDKELTTLVALVSVILI